LVGANQSQFYPQANSAGIDFPAVSTVNLQQGYEHRRFPPPALKNLYVPIAFIEEVGTQTPSAKKFVDDFRRMFPDAANVNQPARCAYVAVHLMAAAWKRAGSTNTDEVISALDPATHHLTMSIRMAQVQPDHSIKFVQDFGPIEPWWLRSLGVNLVRSDDAKQYLPGDDKRFAKFLNK
jgi:ABC-type branched-subunit amino acid transport system substrate-binding protein